MTGLRALGALGIVALLSGCAPPGDDGARPQDDAASAHADAGSVAAVVEESLARRVEILEEKLVSLAEAVPEGSYGWRPMEGVRSVGEVYAHVAADNWFVLAVMGADVPPETGVTTEDATVAAFEERVRAKADIVDGLRASFAALRAALDDDRGLMDREVVLRGTTTAAGDIWIRAIVHLHEHLGQSIAYARSNEVVPPWSQ